VVLALPILFIFFFFQKRLFLNRVAGCQDFSRKNEEVGVLVALVEFVELVGDGSSGSVIREVKSHGLSAIHTVKILEGEGSAVILLDPVIDRSIVKDGLTNVPGSVEVGSGHGVVQRSDEANDGFLLEEDLVMLLSIVVED